jgi:hypothetical protein
MARKHLKTNGMGDVIDEPKIKSKTKPKPWIEPEFMRQLRLDRERYFWQIYPEQRAEIEQRVKEWKIEWAKQDKRK